MCMGRKQKKDPISKSGLKTPADENVFHAWTQQNIMDELNGHLELKGLWGPKAHLCHIARIGNTFKIFSTCMHDKGNICLIKT